MTQRNTRTKLEPRAGVDKLVGRRAPSVYRPLDRKHKHHGHLHMTSKPTASSAAAYFKSLPPSAVEGQRIGLPTEEGGGTMGMERMWMLML